MDDALGHSFLSEIETLYEQMGGRLAHLNAMLSNLPPIEEPPPADAQPHPAPVFTDVAAAYASTIDALPIIEEPQPLALPAPEQRMAILPPQATFPGFNAQIEAGDLEAAGRSLAELFAVDAPRGRRVPKSSRPNRPCIPTSSTSRSGCATNCKRATSTVR